MPARPPADPGLIVSAEFALPEAWLAPGAPPLEIDIGCHKGLFLVEMAQAHPRHNFVGIERQSERVARTRRKIDRLNLPNALAFRGDGAETLRLLPERSVDFIHVLFPDPWPKRRHEMRRLVQPEFLRLCARILKPHALLRLVTDDAPYAASMDAAVAESAVFLHESAPDREYPMTEFERKFASAGLPIHRLALRLAR